MEIETGVVWLAFDMDRSAPPREFDTHDQAQEYAMRKRRETGAHWVVRWKLSGILEAGGK